MNKYRLNHKTLNSSSHDDFSGIDKKDYFFIFTHLLYKIMSNYISIKILMFEKYQFY